MKYKDMVTMSKYTRKNYALSHRNGQNQVPYNDIILFIRYKSIRGKGPNVWQSS